MIPFAHHSLAEALVLLAPILVLVLALAAFVLRERLRTRPESTDDREEEGG